MGSVFLNGNVAYTGRNLFSQSITSPDENAYLQARTVFNGSIGFKGPDDAYSIRSEEHTSELQSLMRISYAVFCLKKKTTPGRPDSRAPYQHTVHNATTYDCPRASPARPITP